MSERDIRYKALAAAVVAKAVKDFESAYKKLRHWDSLQKKGKLKDFVLREVFSQEGKRTKCYNRVTITRDNQSAIDFFKPDSRAGNLFCAMLDIDIDDLPGKLREQVEFAAINLKPLQGKVWAYYNQAQRKIMDKKK